MRRLSSPKPVQVCIRSALEAGGLAVLVLYALPQISDPLVVSALLPGLALVACAVAMVLGPTCGEKTVEVGFVMVG